MCGTTTTTAAAADDDSWRNPKYNTSAGRLRQNGESNSKYTCFQMPLHYPRYKKEDYEKMPEWLLDCLLKEYGLPATGEVDQKRKFAMGAFLWPDEF